MKAEETANVGLILARTTCPHLKRGRLHALHCNQITFLRMGNKKRPNNPLALYLLVHSINSDSFPINPLWNFDCSDGWGPLAWHGNKRLQPYFSKA